MSHTYRHNGTTFIGNSDLSGKITILTDSDEIEVEGNDLLEFIAGHILRLKISELEDSDPIDILCG